MKKKKTGNSQEDLCQPTLVSVINQRTEYPSMQQCKINNTVHYCFFTIYIESSVRKQKIDQALLNMLVKDLVPSHIVEESSFIEFVAVLDPR